MAGALALGACGGRQDDQQTTAQPDVTDPAQSGTMEGQDTTGQDPAGQDPAGQNTTGQDTASPDVTGTPPPEQHMTGQGMHGQDMHGQNMHGQGMGQDQIVHDTGMQGTPDQGMPDQGMHGQTGQPAMAMECPTDVEGTTARTTQTKRGITIAFTAKGKGDVAEVRRRVQQLAEMHNRHHAQGAQDAMHDQHHPQGAQGAMHDQHHAQGAQGAMHDQAGGQAQAGAGGQAAAQGQAGAAQGQAGAAQGQAGAAQGQAGAAAANAMGTHEVLAMTQAKVENMPRGARLVLTVRERGQIERLREPLRIHAESMAAGHCDPMSADPMSGTASGQGTPGQNMQNQGTGASPGTKSQPAGPGTPRQPPTR